MTAPINNVIGKFFPSSLPASDTFAGQRILITGGTAGLGVAAAVHYLNLGAKEVIITARKASSTRADEARQSILAAQCQNHNNKKGGGGNSGEVTVMELDMNSYGSICAFVEALRRKYDGTAGGVDVVVLNAGVMNTVFVKSPEGAEETIQVNTLSTTLLALLLLPWLKQQKDRRRNSGSSGQQGGAGGRGGPAHLVFVGSGSQLDADIKPWPSYIEQDGGVIAHYARKENYPTGALNTSMYAASKLMLHYAVEEVSKLALDGNGEPQVIVTSVCPGPVVTNIIRSLSDHSLLGRLLIPLFYLAQAKSPDYGARIYINASVAGPDKHGKFLRDYLSDKQYEAKSKPMVSSPEARKMQAQIWKEIKESLIAKVPAVAETLQT